MHAREYSAQIIKFLISFLLTGVSLSIYNIDGHLFKINDKFGPESVWPRESSLCHKKIGENCSKTFIC